MNATPLKKTTWLDFFFFVFYGTYCDTYEVKTRKSLFKGPNTVKYTTPLPCIKLIYESDSQLYTDFKFFKKIKS